MRFLLRPGWLAFAAVVIGFAVACYTLLAPWQFGREDQRAAAQAAIDAADSAPPASLAEVTTTGVTPDVEWRKVVVTGTYLPDAEVLVRLRSHEGGPAFEVVTPLRTDDGRVLAVGRGYVAAEDGASVPTYAAAPTGPVTVTARLRVDERDPRERTPVTGDGPPQVFAVDSRAVAAVTGQPVEPGWLQLAPEQAGVLGPLPVEPPSGGAPFTNFSYALQWLTFGVIALFALGYFVRLEVLQRRGDGTDPRTRRSELRRALAGDDSG